MKVLQAIGVTKRYSLDGVEVDALKHADIEVERGEMLAIIGPPGSAKLDPIVALRRD